MGLAGSSGPPRDTKNVRLSLLSNIMLGVGSLLWFSPLSPVFPNTSEQFLLGSVDLWVGVTALSKLSRLVRRRQVKLGQRTSTASTAMQVQIHTLLPLF